jgi:hypothetical protein
MNANLRWVTVSASIVSLLAAWTVACSAPADAGKSDLDLCSAKDDSDTCRAKKKSTKKPSSSDDGNNGPSSSPAPAPTGDGGPPVGTAPPDAGKPPPTTPQCVALNTCCGTLNDFGDTLACIGVALAGNEPSCGAALTVCKAGGVGIGTIFGSSHPRCNALSKCCEEYANSGYSVTAADCREWVEIEDEPSCKAQLEDYQSYGDCQ